MRMGYTMSEPQAPSRVASAFVPAALLAVFGTVGFYFLWRAFHYDGIVGWLGEWQFAKVYFYYPALTVALPVLLCLALVAALFLLGKMLWRRVRKTTGAHVERRAIVIADGLSILFLGFAAVGFVAAIVTLFLVMQHPSDGPVQDIRLGSPAALSPREGKARVFGSIDYTRTARLGDDVALFRREMYIAPIVDPRDSNRPLQFFVEVSGFGPKAGKVPSAATGILTRQALPREIAQLYRNTGSSVAYDNYMLFGSEQSLLWRSLVTAAELALFALVSLIFGLIQMRHRRRLRRDLGI